MNYNLLLLLLVVYFCEAVDRTPSSSSHCMAKNQTAKYANIISSKNFAFRHHFGNATEKSNQGNFF